MFVRAHVCTNAHASVGMCVFVCVCAHAPVWVLPCVTACACPVCERVCGFACVRARVCVNVWV